LRSVKVEADDLDGHVGVTFEAVEAFKGIYLTGESNREATLLVLFPGEGNLGGHAEGRQLSVTHLEVVHQAAVGLLGSKLLDVELRVTTANVEV
jgi:hypothetical protein